MRKLIKITNIRYACTAHHVTVITLTDMSQSHPFANRNAVLTGILCSLIVLCPDPTCEERAFGGIWLIPWASLKIHCLHSWELIANLCAKKVLCHRTEVSKNFRCYNNILYFLQRDWQLEISPQKAINVNEVHGINQVSPDPLRSGRVSAL